MSRSLHTQKLSRRAARRLANPYATRLEGAARLSGRRPVRTCDAGAVQGPRIEVSRPVAGAVQPVTVTLLREWLAALGPASCYGLKAIRLRAETAVAATGIVFAEYALPGEIVLFAVPESPWRLPFVVSSGDAVLFRSFGARVDSRAHGSLVTWPDGGLAAFYRWEVLSHELGHHALQQRKRRRNPVARRADHGSAARLFAVRAWRAARHWKCLAVTPAVLPTGVQSRRDLEMMVATYLGLWHCGGQASE